MRVDSFLQIAVLLFLVMDPLGNLPLFVNMLRKLDGKRFRFVVVRESILALAILSVFFLFGDVILQVMGISEVSLGIAGGGILLIIALKMVFVDRTREDDKIPSEEPLLVPLAIPLIAGPSSIATIILVRSDAAVPKTACMLALIAAWIVGTAILLSGRLLVQWFGKRTLDACESLMGFLLSAIAVEMLVKGVKTAFSI